ncbi:MAG: GNAT family N-acetyltransferase [Chloroflexota bacterium]
MFEIRPPLNLEDKTTISLLAQAALEYPATRRLAPWLYNQVVEREIQLPKSVESSLRQAYLATLRRNIQMQQALQHLLERFAAANLPVLPLKGPLLTQRLYGNLGLRPFSDLDLLVHPQDIIRAARILAETDYRNVSQNQQEFHIKYLNTSGYGISVHLELHRSLLGYQVGSDYLPFGLISARDLTATMWEKTVWGRTADIAHLQLAPEDELLFLCLHLAKHIISERPLPNEDSPLPNLLLALDIHLMLIRWQDRLDEEQFRKRVAAFQLRRPVRLALAFTKHWFDTPVAIAETLPQWQRAYFFERGARNSRLQLQYWNMPRGQVFVDSLLMADSWADRAFLLRWTLRSLARRGRRRLGAVKRAVRSSVPTLRPKKIDLDQVACQLLLTKNIPEIIALYNLKARSTTEANYRKLLDNDANLGMGLFFKQALIGCVWITQQWQPLGIPGHWMGGGHIDAAFRGRGLGKKLFRCALAEAHKCNIKTVYRNARQDNVVSLRAGQAVGFVPMEQPDWQKRLQAYLGTEQIVLVSTASEAKR